MSRTLAFILAIAIACVIRASAHDPITTKVTWSREISRIVAERCAGCHRADGVAPMAFGTYEQTRPWLRAIKDEVISRRMPKWPAARGIGEFQNDRSLSPFEIELIAAWIDGGAPKGDAKAAQGSSPTSAPSPTTRMDRQLRLAARHAPPAGGQAVLKLATSEKRDRWITGWRFRPNDPAILQAEIRLQNGQQLGTWVPLDDAIAFPEGAGIALPARSTIDVVVWYRTAQMQQDFPIGLPARGPELGLMLTDVAPRRPIREILASCGDGTSGAEGDIIAVRPIVDAARASLGVAIHPADGPPQPLAWLREFDPSYQPTYRLRTPVAMRSETRIEVASNDPSCRAYVQYIR